MIITKDRLLLGDLWGKQLLDEKRYFLETPPDLSIHSSLLHVKEE